MFSLSESIPAINTCFATEVKDLVSACSRIVSKFSGETIKSTATFVVLFMISSLTYLNAKLLSTIIFR